MIEPQSNERCRCNGNGVVAATKDLRLMVVCSCPAGKMIAAGRVEIVERVRYRYG